MKRVKAALALSAVLLSAIASAPAFAHHGGGHVRYRVVIGAPYPYYPWGYFPPYYYYPPVITVPAEPTTYIEQGSPQTDAAPQPQGYWYYCAESKTYYPYVKECTGSWQRVTPQPPPGG